MSAIVKEERIGGQRLILGDCLKAMPMLGKFDAVVTDPPYEIKNKFGTSNMYGKRVMQFDFDIEGVTEQVVVPALSIAFQQCNAFHVFLDPEQYYFVAKIARKNGLTPKPFAKKKLCSPPPMPQNWWPSGFELACYGYRAGAFFGDNSANRVNIMTFDSYRHGIRAGEKVDHPTQKWLPMIEYIVGAIVPPNGTAIDLFMGSGTTLVACQRMGRNGTGIELDPEYFDIACRRVDEATRQPDMFIAPPAPQPKQESMI